MVTETNSPTALLRKVEKYELEREQLEEKLEEIHYQSIQTKAVNALTEKEVKNAIEHDVKALDTLNRDDLKELLRKIIDTIILNPID